MDLDELAAASGGTAHGHAPAPIGPDVVIDARAATPGSLFVAIKGERVDGHDFTGQALANGAAAVLGTRSTDADLPHVVVDDPVAGLSNLARHVVDDARAHGLTVVAITGSSGKTSTKDLLAQLLEAAGPTVSPVGSFNNEIGVPLTACKVDAATTYLVSEMGARGIGHIRWLTGIVQPDVSVVLNVGTAHLGEFGSADNIALAKGELVEALDADGWAVLNADDARVQAMADRTRAHLAVFTQSEPGETPVAGLPDADHRAELVVRASDVRADDLQRHSFTLRADRRDGEGWCTETADITLRTVGRHQVANALAAVAAALAAGVPFDQLVAPVCAAGNRSKWRMQLDERADGLAVLNDSYNANPDSMNAALQALGELLRSRRAVHPDARGVAVLGEMLELGADAAAEHERVGRLAAEVGIGDVLVVDAPAAANHAVEMSRGAAGGGARSRVLAKADVVGVLTDELRVGPADVVLVKASRGVALDTVADELLQSNPVEASQSGAAPRGGTPTC